MHANKHHESRDYLTDAATLLQGWTRDGRELRRTLRIDDSQHAALVERIKVVADSVQVQPEVRRMGGCTQIRMRNPEGGVGLSRGEVALAARIEDMYLRLTGETTLP
jgi:4a-hydroxytetrahydrobiopterin dehydratase